MALRLPYPLLAALALLLAGPVSAEPSPAGRYRATEGPDLAAELALTADGRFRYALAYGALDEAASGRWIATGPGEIALTTEPRPTPPAFTLQAIAAQSGAPFLRVTWSDGRGIAGIDVEVGFATGAPVTGYTQEDGWDLPEGERRQPISIRIAEPIHGILSEHLRLPARGPWAVRATLVPNDLGVIDFRAARLTLDGDTALLHRPGGPPLHLARIGERR